MRRLRFSGRLAFVAIALSCAAPREPEPGNADLLFARPAARALRQEDLLAVDPIADVRLDRTGAEKSWRVTGGLLTSAGACLAPGARELRVETGWTSAFAGANRLTFVIDDVRRSPVRVQLRHEGALAPWLERELRWEDTTDSSHRAFRLELDDAETPTAGDELSVAVAAESMRRPCLVRANWSRARLDVRRVAESTGKPLRIEIDSEVRDAVLQSAGRPLRLKLPRAVRRGEALELAFGVWGSAPERVELRVALDHETRSRELLREELDAVPTTTWQRRRLELPDDAEAGTMLELTAAITPRVDVRPPLLAWSEVRLEPAARVPGRTNLLLISIDTLRADRMSAYGAKRPTSPHLAAWAAERAALFEQAIAPAPTTLPSHTSIFTGWNSFRHGVVYTEPAPAELDMLAERLRGAGYRTVAITGAGFLDPRYGLDQGFERYRYWPTGTDSSAELADGLRRALDWLDGRRSEPFFLFFHTYEVHGPYRAREPYFSAWSGVRSPPLVLPEPAPRPRAPGADPPHRFAAILPERPSQRRELEPGELALAADLYDSGVARADEAIGRLIDHLAQVGLADRTMVIVTSDHGESLGEHGLAGHGFLYDDNLRVPLMIALPDRTAAGRRVAAQVRLTDLLPTVLEALGLPPAAGLDGTSLLPLLHGQSPGAPREALAYSSALGLALRIDSRLKLIYYDGIEPDRTLRHRRFRLDDDPSESRYLPIEQAPAWDNSFLGRLHDASGLVVRLPARTSESGTLRLRAPWLTPARVTWLSNPCDCVSAGEDGSVELEGSDSERELLLRPRESPVAPLQVTRELNGRTVATWLVDVGALAHGAPVAAAEAMPFELRWNGQRSGLRRDPAADAVDLREQLEALGYLR